MRGSFVRRPLESSVQSMNEDVFLTIAFGLNTPTLRGFVTDTCLLRSEQPFSFSYPKPRLSKWKFGSEPKSVRHVM